MTDSSDAAFIFIILAVLVIWVLYKYIKSFFVVVDTGKFKVTKRFGKMQRVLRPGLQMLWPNEHVVSVTWSFAEENVGGAIAIKVKTETDFCTSATAMDIPTINAKTSDNVSLGVNVIMYWCVGNDQRCDSTPGITGDPAIGNDAAILQLFSKHSSPFEFLNHMTRSAVYSTVSEFDSVCIRKMGYDALTEKIAANLRKYTCDTALTIKNVVLQKVNWPISMDATSDANATKTRELQAELQQAQLRQQIATTTAETHKIDALNKAECMLIIAEASTKALLTRTEVINNANIAYVSELQKLNVSLGSTVEALAIHEVATNDKVVPTISIFKGDNANLPMTTAAAALAIGARVVKSPVSDDC